MICIQFWKIFILFLRTPHFFVSINDWIINHLPLTPHLENCQYMISTKIRLNSHTRSYLLKRESTQKTNTMMKSFPPASTTAGAASSSQCTPLHELGHIHRKWRKSLKFMQVPPFWQIPGSSHSFSSIHWVAPSLLCPTGQLK